MSFFQAPSKRDTSTLPLIDSALLLPLDSRNPACPLPNQVSCGGGGAGASSASAVPGAAVLAEAARMTVMRGRRRFEIKIPPKRRSAARTDGLFVGKNTHGPQSGDC